MTLPRPQPAPAAPRRSTSRRLAVVAGVAGVVLLGAAGGVLAYVNRPDTAPDDGTSPIPSAAASLGPGPAESPQPVPGASAGGRCEWYDNNTTARLTDGRSVRCEWQDDGTYRWKLIS